MQDTAAADEVAVQDRLVDGRRVRIVRLRRPPYNALTPGMIAALRAAIDQAVADRPEALVVASAVDHFSVGADVRAFHLASQDAKAATQLVGELVAQMHPAYLRLREAPFPTCAAVRGMCAGGALGLALACDIRVATPDARFATGHLTIGLTPDGGATFLLPRLAPPQRARDLLLFGGTASGEEAEREGWVDALAEPARLDQAAIDQALGRAGGQSLGAARALWDGGQAAFRRHLAEEERAILEASRGEEFRERVARFVARGGRRG